MADRASDDTLKRETAGRYRTPDRRFTVEAEGANAWYVADEEQVDQLGQPVLRGPFPTLAAARSAVADARHEPVVGRDLPKTTSTQKAAREPARPKAKTATIRRVGRREQQRSRSAERDTALPEWLAELEPGQRAAAERLADELSGLGVEEPEQIVAEDLRSDEPLVAEAILSRRLHERLGNDKDVAAVLEILRDEGFRPGAGRPPFGWRLVELDRQGQPSDRRFRVRRS